MEHQVVGEVDVGGRRDDRNHRGSAGDRQAVLGHHKRVGPGISEVNAREGEGIADGAGQGYPVELPLEGQRRAADGQGRERVAVTREQIRGSGLHHNRGRLGNVNVRISGVVDGRDIIGAQRGSEERDFIQAAAEDLVTGRVRAQMEGRIEQHGREGAVVGGRVAVDRLQSVAVTGVHIHAEGAIHTINHEGDEVPPIAGEQEAGIKIGIVVPDIAQGSGYR